MNEYMDPGILQPVDPTTVIPQGIEAYLWPEINTTVTWIAFIVGILIYFIGYFSGGKENRPKIIITMIVSGIVGFLGRGIMNPVVIFMVISLNFSPRYANVLTSFVWLMVTVGTAIYLYETLVVTAKEAHPD